MLIKELHDYFGTWSNLSRSLKLGSTTYQTWLRNGYVPYTTQLRIEKLTDGLFVALEEHGKPSSKKNYDQF